MSVFSKNEVITKYNAIVALIASRPETVRGRTNCYLCRKPECRHITKTLCIHEGVTPMLFHCEKCGEIAESSGFRDLVPNQKATIAWYRPTLRDVLKIRKTHPFIVEHILKGGLGHKVIGSLKK